MMKQFVWLFFALTLCSYSQTPGNGATDIDGNQYNSVIICTQEWMKENLNVTKYSDGTPIPQVTNPTQWVNLTTGAWCFYQNNTANGPVYGKLYNWYAVAGIYDAASAANPALRKKLAPTGWHVPSDGEWSDIINCLDPNANGGATFPNIAGGKMKSTGNLQASTGLWQIPNADATNTSGFTGLPGGFRFNDGIFESIWVFGSWWSSTEDTFPNAWARFLNFDNGNAARGSGTKSFASSVRCIKNSSLNYQSFNFNSFNIYPNPAKDYININISNLTDINGWSYKILNTLGQEVINGEISQQQNIVQLNNIKVQGIYFVKIYDSSNNLMDTKKIIIQQ
jgi:uncharacterized protein (TIGR02145 family)